MRWVNLGQMEGHALISCTFLPLESVPVHKELGFSLLFCAQSLSWVDVLLQGNSAPASCPWGKKAVLPNSRFQLSATHVASRAKAIALLLASGRKTGEILGPYLSSILDPNFLKDEASLGIS